MNDRLTILNRKGGLCRFACAVFCVVSLAGPAAKASDISEFWGKVTAKGAFSETEERGALLYRFSVEYRVGLDGFSARRVQLQPALGMRLSENSTVWAGYTRIHTDLEDNVSISEDRYWQQWSWRMPWCEVLTCALRARLEQRSIEGLPDRLHRFRLRTEFSRRFDWSGNVRWLLSLEPFVNLTPTRTPTSTAIRQSRVFLGFELDLTEWGELQAGYMKRSSWGDSALQQSTHIAVLSFTASY